ALLIDLLQQAAALGLESDETHQAEALRVRIEEEETTVSLLTAAIAARTQAFWRQRLRGRQTARLAPDAGLAARVDAAAGRPAGHVRLTLDAARWRRLQHIARTIVRPPNARGVSPFTVLLTIWAATLARVAQRDDVVLAVPIDVGAPDDPADARAIACRVHQVPVCLAGLADGARPLDALLAHAHDRLHEARTHGALAFDAIVACTADVRPPADREGPALTAWGCSLLPVAPRLMPPDGIVRARPHPMPPAHTHLDVLLEWQPIGEADGGGLVGQLTYARDRHAPTTARRLARTVTRALDRLIADSAQALDALLAPDAAERHQLRVAWGAPPAAERVASAATSDDPLRPLLRALTDAPAARILLHHADRAITAAMLRRAVQRVGRRLTSHRPDDRRRQPVVALALGRRPSLMAALLAALAQGWTIVPRALRADASLDALARHLNGLPTLDLALVDRIVPGCARPQIALDDARLFDGADDPADDATAALFASSVSAAWRHPAALAYSLGTSGRSGPPKRVEVSRAALMGVVRAMDARLRDATDGASRRWLATTAIDFDIALLELLLPLLRGESVHLLAGPDEVPALLRTTRAVGDAPGGAWALQATPTVWRALLPDLPTPTDDARRSGKPRGGGGGGESPKPLALALVGGEAPSAALIEALRARADSVVHVYGPTEATIWATAGRLDGPRVRRRRRGVDAEAPPAGRPLSHAEILVLDDRLRPLPLGAVGDVWLAGPALARGYAAQPGRTAARFRPHPTSARAGARIYATGDRGRFLPDGRLQLRGRRDREIKVRGRRVALPLLESILRHQPGVRDAAVVDVPTPVGTARLVAFAAAAPSAVTGSALRRAAPEIA
ncbi:MAG: AMP-binding protein, partial [Acidobacteriota bacterium]